MEKWKKWILNKSVTDTFGISLINEMNLMKESHFTSQKYGRIKKIDFLIKYNLKVLCLRYAR